MLISYNCLDICITWNIESNYERMSSSSLDTVKTQSLSGAPDALSRNLY